MSNDNGIATELQHALRRLLYATIVLYVVMIVVVTVVYRDSNSKLNHRSKLNSAALCAYRDALQQRIDDAAVTLRAHPEGAHGFSAEQLSTMLTNQKAVLASFLILECP